MENAVGFDVRLPGGLRRDGGVHRDVVLCEMTGEDEENISNPAIATNGGKIITTLLANCVKKLGSLEVNEDVIKNLFMGDRDFLMLKLRVISIGNEFNSEVTCPNCQSKFAIVVDLNDVETKELPDDKEGIFPFKLAKGYTDSEGVTHKEGLMKLPTGIEQEYLASDAGRNRGVATTQLLTKCCVRLGKVKPITTDIIKKLSSRDREIMAKTMMGNMPGPDLNCDVECVVCKNKWQQSLLVSNFFAPTRG